MFLELKETLDYHRFSSNYKVIFFSEGHFEDLVKFHYRSGIKNFDNVQRCVLRLQEFILKNIYMFSDIKHTKKILMFRENFWKH